MTILGAIARPNLPPELIAEVALAGEASGLEELWVWEDSYWEGGISMSAALLGMTDRLRVGVGLLPVPLRNVTLAAMEIAAVDRLFPGRFVAGLGHGVQEWMGQSGVRAASPMTLMREYIGALRPLLQGEEVTVTGDYVNLDRVKLVWPPSVPTPLHIGGVGPNSLRVSGEVGDGTILVSDTTVDDLPRILGLVDEGRSASGRPGEHVVTVFVSAAVEDPAAIAERVAAWTAAGAHRVVLEPAADEPDPVGFVRFVAQQVQPLVSSP
jgi:alkanesulfonate monooxygenase SsuD/methylene tetrahydromethanopterin reductase-like flavin-dependent oxidoreductase (luciferase family)